MVLLNNEETECVVSMVFRQLLLTWINETSGIPVVVSNFVDAPSTEHPTVLRCCRLGSCCVCKTATE